MSNQFLKLPLEKSLILTYENLPPAAEPHEIHDRGGVDASEPQIVIKSHGTAETGENQYFQKLFPFFWKKSENSVFSSCRDEQIKNR